MLEFLMNIASSVYFVFGASIVLVICMLFIIIPMMNRMKQLDEIVQLKLKLLPTSKFYSTILSELNSQQETISASLDKFITLENNINHLSLILNGLDIENLSGKISDMLTEKNNIIIHEFDDLEKSLLKFTRRFRDDEKRSEVQLCNLVAAEIDFTDFLLKVLRELHDKDMIKSVQESDITLIKNNLQNGYDSVTKNGNYRSFGSNSRSGDFDKFIDKDF